MPSGKKKLKNIILCEYKKYHWHALAFHFVRWLIIHGTRESKISGGGVGFVRFSYFMYVTCCHAVMFLGGCR